jgi:hypothetical protein
MGIVAYCPNGHRVKVKDELAGRKGVCPECQARFRIPRGEAAGAGGATRTAGGYPVARVVSLDPAVAAGLPRAVAMAPASTSLHPALAERPEATWSLAVPGGEASAPMSADAMQSLLDAGGLTGDELVWREGWADWVSIRLVFPEYLSAIHG